MDSGEDSAPRASLPTGGDAEPSQPLLDVARLASAHAKLAHLLELARAHHREWDEKLQEAQVFLFRDNRDLNCRTFGAQIRRLRGVRTAVHDDTVFVLTEAMNDLESRMGYDTVPGAGEGRDELEPGFGSR